MSEKSKPSKKEEVKKDEQNAKHEVIKEERRSEAHPAPREKYFSGMALKYQTELA